MIATGPPAAAAASWAPRPSPSPPSTASTISRWTARSRSTSEPWRAGSVLWAAANLRHLLGLGGRAGVRLQGLLTGLAGADPVRLVHRQHEHLAVADRTGARVLEDRVHDRLHVARRDHTLDLHLRAQVVRELGAAVALGDALLPPGPLDLHDRERGEAEGQQLHADGLERLVPDERFDLLHDAGTSWVVWAGAAGVRPRLGAESPTSSGAGMNCSGYPYMPCSAMSRPASSASSLTRSPIVALIAPSTASERTRTVTKVSTTATACTPSCSKPPPSKRPALPTPTVSARRSEV